MTIDRRQIIRGAGTLAGVLLAQNLPLWAHADVRPTAAAPGTFIMMSSALTGIPPGSLQPVVSEDNLAIADVYFYALQSGSPAYWSQLLTAYNQYANQGMSPQQIAQAMLAVNNQMRVDYVGTLSRLTAMMWMFGGWYGALENSNNPKYAPAWLAPGYLSDMVLSSRAYKTGWVWRVAQAHPMGFSQFAFGSWADEPPSLSDYGVIA